MHLFVYEFITGGGTLVQPRLGPPHGSLLDEGRRMLEDVVADLACIDGVSVTVMRDARVELTTHSSHVLTVSDSKSTTTAFRQLAADADYSLIIAPEIDDTLTRWADRVTTAGGRLLGPSLELIRLASDKRATADFLKTHGVRVSTGQPWLPGTRCPVRSKFPLVVKPRFGAGCHGVRKVFTEVDLAEALTAAEGEQRLEAFVYGQPTSVSAICRDDASFDLLPPSTQRLSDRLDRYLGGGLLRDARLITRAHDLADRVLSVLPGKRGYLSIDMILADDGRPGDCVVEVNPRLTTSYHWLRAERIAERMLESYATS